MPTYVVTDHAGKKRVVESKTPAGARAHVAADLTVAKITTRECFQLSTEGLTLETAGEQPANENDGGDNGGDSSTN